MRGVAVALWAALAGVGCGDNGVSANNPPAARGGTGGGGAAPFIGDASDASAKDASNAVPPRDPCVASHCLNGGTCATGVDGGATCACPAGFAGVTCASNIDDCLPNPCLNGGACVDGIASATCTCTSAFTGARCELPRFQTFGSNAPCGGSVVATAISADGSTIVGYCGTQAAFLWTFDGGFADLGISSATALESLGFAVNADGSALLSRFSRADGTSGALRWNAGAGTTDVLVQPASTELFLNAASGDLSVIVGAYDDATLPAGDQLGFRFTAAGGLKTLAVPDQSAYGCGTFSVSTDGTVMVGACYDAANVLRASRWRVQPSGDVVLDLPDTSANQTYAYGVSGDGNVVVGYSFDGTNQHAIRFVGDGPFEDLGALPGTRSGASAANSDGSVIIGFSELAQNPFTDAAIVWDAQNGLRAIAGALTAAGVDLSTWKLSFPAAISADGKTIVGNGTAPDGIERFWIARLY